MIKYLLILIFISYNFTNFAGNSIKDYLENDWERTKNEIGLKNLLYSGGWISGMYLLSFQDENIHEFAKPVYEGKLKHYFDTVDYLGDAPYSIPASAGFAGLTFLFNDQKLRHAALTSVESALITSVIVTTFKISVGRNRPFKNNGPHFFEPFTDWDASFPSGHTAVAFALITPFVVYYDNPLGYAFLILPASTGISRIVLDKHWATDVLTGGVVGYLVGYYLAKWHKDFSKSDSQNNSTPIVTFTFSL